MLFSVIIPIYNAENTLHRCIDSLINQAKDRAELILVNDGSTDGSGEICTDYAARYPQIVYIWKENGGVSSARNIGLQKATCRFVTFVDSDDFVSNNYFDIISENLSFDTLVFGELLTQNNAVIGSIIPFGLNFTHSYDEFIEAFVRSRNGSPCNKRFLRSVLVENSICFPEDLRIGEDFVFCMRYLLHAGSAKAVNECIYLVDTSNQQSNSRKYNADVCSQALLNYRYSFDEVVTANLPQTKKDSLEQILDYNYHRTALACIQELFKVKMSFSERLRRAKEILIAFSAESHRVRACNLTHMLLRTIVRRRLANMAYVIALIHLKNY